MLAPDARGVFDPPTEYDISRERMRLKEFHDYADEYIVRPPYQRTTVWGRQKKLRLLDSLFRRYYVPHIVLRNIRLTADHTIREVIDGQQRITVAQAFYRNELPLPKTLEDVSTSLPGKLYKDLPPNVRRFVDSLKYDVDIVKGIDDPRDAQHQSVARRIFGRLQEGEDLTYMERANGLLSSLRRNFVVKYGDDVSFNYDLYQPIDENPDKDPFFREIVKGSNERKQHLGLLTRLVMCEEANGPTDIGKSHVSQFIEDGQDPEGIGNDSYEQHPTARATLANMRAFYSVFKNEEAIVGGGARGFRVEYFVLSLYLLLRHLKNRYVFGEAEATLLRRFTIAFHQRWLLRREDDNEMLVFVGHQQQTGRSIDVRQRIIWQLFIEHAKLEGVEVKAKDRQRTFTELQRLEIYRRDEGICQACRKEGRSEKEAWVPWSEYDADHILPHSKGGETSIENAQVLCRTHNLIKGSTVEGAG